MKEPRVTVIVAAFNGERFLRETLESVFGQDFASFEVVFVDDGSRDGTGEIAQSFPVRYVRQENRGLPAARNTGLALARGDLIAFLDDDDVLPSTKLSVQVRYLDEHPETGCVLGRQEWILEEGVEPPPLVRDPIFGELGGIQLVTAMIRRRVLEELGGFDPSYRYAEDRDLFIRMREHGVEIAVLPEVVLHKRLHGSNMTMNAPTTHPMLRSLREKLERDPIFDELGGIQLVTMMIRRSAFEQLGGFDPTYRYAEDRDLFVRLREHGIEYAVLPDLVLYKRLHGSNMTMNRPESHPILRSLKEKLDRSRSEV